MRNHKFNLDGNNSRVIPVASYTAPSPGNRGDGPRTIPAPKPVPAPPKQK